MEEKRNSKILTWLKDPYNLLLLIVLIFAFILRIKYLNTIQAVWWDSAEYLSAAKNWAFNIPYDISPQRQPLYTLILAGLYKLGISSLPILLFLTVLLPSFLVVFLTYLLGKEVYNKKIGLIAAFIMSSFWVSLFWSNRISTDHLGFLFGLLALYFFWTGYEKQKSKVKIFLMGLFLGLGFLTRVGGVLVIFIIISYLLITRRHKIILDKTLWSSALISITAIIPYLIWNYLHFKNPLAFFGGYFGEAKASQKFALPIAWNLFNYFKLYLDWILFIVFIIGIIYLLFNLILGFDLLLKNQNKDLNSDLFSLLMILVPMIFFVFIERQAEPRWIFIMTPSIFFIVGKSLLLIQDQLKKHIKFIATILIVIILIAGIIPGIKTAHTQIISKKDSYIQFKEAGLWLKENSKPEDVIFSNGVPQTSFYSERHVWSMGGGTPEKFEELVKETKTRYLVISLLEREPEWLSIEGQSPQGFVWQLPYFDSQALFQNGKLVAAQFKDQPIQEFPPKTVQKSGLTFNLVYNNNGLFIYEITIK